MSTSLRSQLRLALRSAGALESTRRARAAIARLTRRVSIRRLLAERRQFLKFADRYGAALTRSGLSAPAHSKTALIVGRIGRTPEAQVMAARVLQWAGYTPTVLLLNTDDRYLRRYLDLAGVHTLEWPTAAQPARFINEARALLGRCHSLQAVLDLESEGVRVGRSALSTTLRVSQVGLLELDVTADDPRLIRGMAAALAAARTAREVIGRVAPALTLSYEMEYTPKRELFDATLARGGMVVSTCRAPRRDALLLKRYTAAASHDHPTSLSAASWQSIQHMPWTAAHRLELETVVRQCYESGDWWGVPPAHQRNAGSPSDVRTRLGLDPSKKTAFIFPHVPWDASFCWGADVFGDYQTWLLETLRAACDNPRVNWVVKIHPANLDKSVRMRDGADPIEIGAIRHHLGTLPSHVVLLRPETEISTLSLFAVMDYCLTVRGTVGLEAASRGIPVLTGGTGRYDRRGFTIDSESASQYLERVKRIEDIPAMTATEQDLAARFAYGMFVLRPVALEPALARCLAMGHESRTDVRSRGPEIASLIAWLRDSVGEDFLGRDPFVKGL
ncbi:MAG: hypothetical protein IPL75_02615 [Acidobacteria bacterium]|nr:hypothetical protein [Acidobacteriota bacterium]